MRIKGKITTWNDEQGFGFVTPHGGAERVFIHIKAFANRSRRPQVGQRVTFGLARDKQGRPCAIAATWAGERLRKDVRRKDGTWSMLGAAIFLGILGAAVLMERTSVLVLALYVGVSLLTFAIYAADKSAARQGAWRTPENTLHLLSLAGGWPGALIAQQTLRHKSRKASFRTAFWATVLVNGTALAWCHTPTGSATLRALLDAVT